MTDGIRRIYIDILKYGATELEVVYNEFGLTQVKMSWGKIRDHKSFIRMRKYLGI